MYNSLAGCSSECSARLFYLNGVLKSLFCDYACEWMLHIKFGQNQLKAMRPCALRRIGVTSEKKSFYLSRLI